MQGKRPERTAEVVKSIRDTAALLGKENYTHSQWTAKEIQNCLFGYAERIEKAVELDIAKAVLDGLTKAVVAVESVRGEQWDEVHRISLERIAEGAS